jgi:hypothetical protein
MLSPRTRRFLARGAPTAASTRRTVRACDAADPAVSASPPDRRRGIAVDALSQGDQCELVLKLFGQEDELRKNRR